MGHKHGKPGWKWSSVTKLLRCILGNPIGREIMSIINEFYIIAQFQITILNGLRYTDADFDYQKTIDEGHEITNGCCERIMENINMICKFAKLNNEIELNYFWQARSHWSPTELKLRSAPHLMKNLPTCDKKNCKPGQLRLAIRKRQDQNLNSEQLKLLATYKADLQKATDNRENASCTCEGTGWMLPRQNLLPRGTPEFVDAGRPRTRVQERLIWDKVKIAAALAKHPATVGRIQNIAALIQQARLDVTTDEHEEF